MTRTMIGGYGPWAAGLLPDPPRLSFRRAEFTDVDAWRRRARERVRERLAAPPGIAARDVETLQRLSADGLDMERLRWRVGPGPPTEAVLLKPAGATGRLPGVLALHCHGGRKAWGWKKVARLAGTPAASVRAHHEQYYGGRAWANELARRGCVVLAHDAFAFASRRVRMAEVAGPAAGGAEPVEPDDRDADSLAAYNAFAADHEHIMAKALFCAGTTWPGVFWAEDRAALDVLAARDEVDPARLGCAGLSGGGLRTVLLAGLDERIRCCSAVGFMSTWRDFLLHKCHTHTWMLYVPLLPGELDFPEILALRAPAATMVQSCTEDPLYTPEEVRAAEGILREVFAKAGGADRLDFRYHPGGHKFDAGMQDDAFEFLLGELAG